MGLDWRAAFLRVISLSLNPLRLSAYWDEVDSAGYGDLDRLMAEASASGRQVLLTVGMKGQGWPEFYIPQRLMPAAPARTDVSAASDQLRAEVLEFVATTLRRYRDREAVVAWQIENEPLNPSGPRGWWIGPAFVADEIATARDIDPHRPLAISVFCSFNPWIDAASSRHGLDVARLLGAGAQRPEAEALGLLRSNDILGLDVYRRIGYRGFGLGLLTRSRHWQRNVTHWVAEAAAHGMQAWVVEAQAEPWESQPRSGRRPRSCRPEELAAMIEGLKEAGCTTLLLWGVEHWLAREAAGDDSWVAAYRRLRVGYHGTVE